MRAVLLVPLALLAACGDEMTDAERKAKEEADVAFVSNLQAEDPPPKPIDPQVIGYPDIEQYKLFGASCAFAPETSLGAIVLAIDDTAWMKIEGKMVRLAADTGGKSLPMGTWQHYDGKEFSLELEAGEGRGKPAGVESVTYPATLTVHDPYDQLVYGASGTLQCGA